MHTLPCSFSWEKWEEQALEITLPLAQHQITGKCWSICRKQSNCAFTDVMLRQQNPLSLFGPWANACALLSCSSVWGWGLGGRGAPWDGAGGAGQQHCERMAGAEALPGRVSAFCQQQWWRKLLQLSLKSLCHIVKILSASQLICSHLYQLPALALNSCLRFGYNFLLSSLSPSVLKRTWDEGDDNAFPAASTASRLCDPYTMGPTAMNINVPSPGSAGDDTLKGSCITPWGSPKVLLLMEGLSKGNLCVPSWHHSASPPLHLPDWGSPDKAWLRVPKPDCYLRGEATLGSGDESNATSITNKDIEESVGKITHKW